MSNQQGDFIWYELLTPDPDASKTFYDAVVGWSIGARPSGPIDYRMIDAPDGAVGGVMHLSDDMKAGGGRPLWLGYVGVDDVDASAAAIVEAGGKTLVPPSDIPDVGRFSMLTDPQGVPFYIMRGNSPEASRAFDREAIGHCSWNELATSDMPAALDFYTRQFGWIKGDVMPMGDMGNYQFIDHGGQMIGAMMQRRPDGPPPVWTFYFRVADIDAAGDQVRSGGGQVFHGPTEVPGGDYIILAADPHGAMFGLVGAKS